MPGPDPASSAKCDMAYAFTYILASKPKGVLYVGVTTDLEKRMAQHKSGEVEGFTQRYNVKQLVWFQESEGIESAIAEEKRIKNWKREWKIELIEKTNPYWKDLSQEFT